MTTRGPIVGRSDALRRVIAIVDKLATCDARVLLTGETGTGKELFAAALHDASHRHAQPLVTVDCGALPEALFERELFGHVRGAFTGAGDGQRGWIATAEGGTLVLDEVGELSPRAQTKLLRFTQEREYRPVGASHAERANVRIVGSTHQNLERKVERGTFRSDLYYRLDGVRLHIPPLRERVADIAPLAHHFLDRAVSEAGCNLIVGFSEAALERLAAHPWPGNVRELFNVVVRAALTCRHDVICCEDLQLFTDASRFDPVLTLSDDGVDLRKAMTDYHRHLLLLALDRARGNRSRAARLLRISRTTLTSMLARLGEG